jgi:hypothetical protein
MTIEDTTFHEFKGLVAGKEGIVCLGAGGEPQEWIDGILAQWKELGICRGNVFSHIYRMTTSGGRIDLAMVFKRKVNIAKIATWRIRFGDCSWISDYLVNYWTQHAN